MMAFPKYNDEALVVLKITDKSTNTQTPNLTERRVLLSSTKPSIKIGRTSRRKAELEATSNNFYFDCPVMSREHAVLFLDENKVSIKDASSLHGTCVNMSQLHQNERRQIHGGDILTFGTTVDRGTIQYSPFEVEADITFGTEASRAAAVTYKVPDESEIEDISSDDDAGLETSPEMDYTSRHLKEHGIRPAKDCHPSIDLTSDNDASVTSAIVPAAHGLQQTQASPSIPAPPITTGTQGYCIDLTQTFDDSAVHHEIQSGPETPGGMGQVLLDLGYDDDDDDDDEEDDLDWDNDSLPDASVSSHDSDVLEVSAQHNFPLSGNATHAVVGSLGFEDEDGPEPENTYTLPSIVSALDDFDDEILPMEENISPSPSQRDSVIPQELMGGSVEARGDNQARIARQNDQGISPYPGMGLTTPHHSGHVASSADNHLVESSLRFLSSPTKDDLPTPVPVAGCMFDDTSAYTFEMSKKAAQASQQASSGVNTAEKTLTEECLTENADESPRSVSAGDQPVALSAIKITEPKHRGMKRSIDEISRTTHQEEQSVSGLGTNNVMAPDGIEVSALESSTAPATLTFTSGIALSCQPTPATYVSRPRPIKRLKRAAEVFGYVALGGVAVMSALIATAPTL